MHQSLLTVSTGQQSEIPQGSLGGGREGNASGCCCVLLFGPQVTDQISALCDSRGVSCELRRTHDAGAVLSDERMVRRAREVSTP